MSLLENLWYHLVQGEQEDEESPSEVDRGGVKGDRETFTLTLEIGSQSG